MTPFVHGEGLFAGVGVGPGRFVGLSSRCLLVNGIGVRCLGSKQQAGHDDSVGIEAELEA